MKTTKLSLVLLAMATLLFACKPEVNPGPEDNSKDPTEASVDPGSSTDPEASVDPGSSEDPSEDASVDPSEDASVDPSEDASEDPFIDTWDYTPGEEYSSSDNLWKAIADADAEGYSGAAMDHVTKEQSTYRFQFADATGGDWANFGFIYIDGDNTLNLSAGKSYSFTYTMCATKDVPRAFLKINVDNPATETHEDARIWETTKSLTAGTPLVVSDVFRGMDAQKVSFTIDFGGNPSDVVIYLKDITIKEAPAPDNGEMTWANNTSRGGEYKVPAEAGYKELFWEAVQVRDPDSDWRTVEARDDASFYNALKIESSADWLRPSRKENDTWICINYDANTGAERSATVTITFPEECNGYKLVGSDANPFTFVVKQDAYEEAVSLDYNSSKNLWKAVDEGHYLRYFFYYAPGWSPIYDNLSTTSPENLSASGSSYEFTYASATWASWQNQTFFHPYDNTHFVSLSSSKTYSFQVTVHSTSTFRGYFKLEQYNAAGAPKYEGATIWEKGDINLKAGEDLVIQKTGITGQNCENINLVFDFGGNPENTKITIKDIIVMEE